MSFWLGVVVGFLPSIVVGVSIYAYISIRERRREREREDRMRRRAEFHSYILDSHFYCEVLNKAGIYVIEEDVDYSNIEISF